MEFVSAIVALSLASKATLLDAVEQRRLRRLGTQEISEPVSQVRVGRQIRNASLSPRRIRGHIGARVTAVRDGSVFDAWASHDVHLIVRLLGADAPLVSASESRSAPSCYGKEAATRLSALLLNQAVTLEEDPSYRKDGGNRSLFYVALNGMDINAWMIQNGYAFADRNNDFARSTRYVNLEEEAKQDERGLWSPVCDYNLNPKHRIRVIE